MALRPPVTDILEITKSRTHTHGVLYEYSGTSLIRPPTGQVLLDAIMRWPEYNVNSIKRFAQLWHKMALLWSMQLGVCYYLYAIINTNGMNVDDEVELSHTCTLARTDIQLYIATHTRFVNKCYWERSDFHNAPVCKEGMAPDQMAPRKGSNGRVRIGGEGIPSASFTWLWVWV